LWSRACSGGVILPDLRFSSASDWVARLEGHLAANDYDLLLPGTDESLYLLARFRAELERHVQVGVPDIGVVERALDKARLASEGTNVGLPAPEGILCNALDEALAAARELRYPVMVKGACAISLQDGKVRRFPSRRVSDDDELRLAHEQVGACIVQAVEAGSLVSFGGVMSDEGLLGTVISRYRRTWPPGAGSVSFSQTIEPPGDLVERVSELLDRIGWRGLFELELIDVGGGVIKAIDLNPRPYGSLALAEASGAPLASIWCAALLGEQVAPATSRAGVSYRWEDGDIRYILWQARNGHIREAARAMMPERGAVHPFLRGDDALPFVARAIELARVRSQNVRGTTRFRWLATP
jgi:predicted ATP-grasp superfamily ATP-dependent carboligase